MSGSRWRRALRRPAFVAPLAALPVLVVLAVLAFNSGGDEGSAENSAEAPSTTAGPGQRSGHRPTGTGAGQQGEGSALTLGEEGRAGGLTVVVEDAAVEPDPGGRDELVVSVTLRNDSDERQDYGLPAFTLEIEGGRIEFPVPSSRQDALIRGSLEPGGSVSGVVVFRAGEGSYVFEVASGDPERQERTRWTFAV